MAGTDYNMCLNPMRAEINTYESKQWQPGKSGAFFGIKIHQDGNLKLPCGKCSECISLRAVEWATRARHEISQHEENCFLTLTYNDQNLPGYLPEEFKLPFQKFLKRLRKKLKTPIRYMVSHEYGSKFFRPHHHIIIFGYNPQNQKLLKTTPSGEKLFTSTEIESLWGLGFHSIGTANERTAYYIASYALKGKKHNITLPNGETIAVSDQFNASSRPAIGLNYLESNKKQIVHSGTPIPRYYTKKLERLDPDLHAEYKDAQASNLKERSHRELHAKYVLDQYKKSSLDNEFRSTPESTKEEKYKLQNLEDLRDQEHEIKTLNKEY